MEQLSHPQVEQVSGGDWILVNGEWINLTPPAMPPPSGQTY